MLKNSQVPRNRFYKAKTGIKTTDLAGKIGCRPCPSSGLWTEHEPDRYKTSIRLR